MHLPNKIPTLLALFFLIALVIGVSTITNTLTSNITQASSSIEPVDVRMTNVTDKGFTVTWTTEEVATGSITVNDGKISRTYSDDRDKNGKLGKYLTHSVSVRDTKPNTIHQVRLLSNGKMILKNQKPFIVTSASVIDQVSSTLEPAYGTLVTSENNPAPGMLVYLTLEGGQDLSVLTGATGSWIIPLNIVRTVDLSGRLPIADRIDEHLLITNGKDESTAISDTLNDSPYPSMVIGKTYDFRKQQAKLPSKSMGDLASVSTAAQAVLGSQTDKQPARSYSVTITQPDDNASLISNLPLFAGTGIPGKEITLTIGIKKPSTAKTIVDKDGLWKYSQTDPLDVGRQSVTVSTHDSYDKPIAITHRFDVLKSGTQVLGIATPSATIAPTVEPTIEPTIEPSPTSTIAGQQPPTTGSALPTMLLIGISTILVFSGLVLARR